MIIIIEATHTLLHMCRVALSINHLKYHLLIKNQLQTAIQNRFKIGSLFEEQVNVCGTHQTGTDEDEDGCKVIKAVPWLWFGCFGRTPRVHGPWFTAGGFSGKRHARLRARCRGLVSCDWQFEELQWLLSGIDGAAQTERKSSLGGVGCTETQHPPKPPLGGALELPSRPPPARRLWQTSASFTHVLKSFKQFCDTYLLKSFKRKEGGGFFLEKRHVGRDI